MVRLCRFPGSGPNPKNGEVKLSFTAEMSNHCTMPELGFHRKLSVTRPSGWQSSERVPRPVAGRLEQPVIVVNATVELACQPFGVKVFTRRKCGRPAIRPSQTNVDVPGASGP